jgi:hypothetical protein
MDLRVWEIAMPENSKGVSLGKPISIDLDPFGPKVGFKTFDSVDSWAVNQIAGISRMLTIPGFGKDVLSAAQIPLSEIHELAISVIDLDRPTAKMKKETRSEIVERLKGISKAESFLQGSPIHNSIAHLLNQRNHTGVSIIAGIIGYPLDILFNDLPPKVDAFKELTTAYVSGAILAGRLEPNYAYTRQALNKLISDGRTALDQQAAAFEKEAENRSKEAAAAAKDIEAARLEMIGVKNEFVELKATHEAEMAQIRKVFQDELALKEPATYWTDKRAKHAMAAAGGAVGFLLVAGFGVDFMWNELPSIIDSISGHLVGVSVPGETADTAKEVLDGAQPSIFEGLSGLALVTIPAIVFLWILKLFARVFVENLHNMQDASQRSTMVVTYLALLKDKTKPISREERLLILDALFRPQAATAGDDGPPSKWVGAMIGRGK